jgi:hypothetical protein
MTFLFTKLAVSDLYCVSKFNATKWASPDLKSVAIIYVVVNKG